MPLMSFIILILCQSLLILSALPSHPVGKDISQRTVLLNEIRNSVDIFERCDLEQINAHNMSAEEFQNNVRGQDQPIVLTDAANFNLAGARVAPLSRDAFIAAFGHMNAGGSNGRFDGGRKEQQQLNVADLLSLPSSDLKFFLTDRTFELHREVLHLCKDVLPSYLDNFIARPILSVGTSAATTWFHRHTETWFMLLAGAKLWYLADNSIPVKQLESIDPWSLLESQVSGNFDLPKGIKFFVQQPGDLLYLPPGVQHATCNLENFTFGLGGQGHMESWPAVLQAAQRGDIDALQTLLASGGDLNVVNSMGQTALHLAALRGDSVMADVLIKGGCDSSKSDRKGFHPLHVATTHGHLPVVALLREEGCRVDQEVVGTESPILLAANAGHVPVTKFLLEHRADPNSLGLNKNTPLHYAADGGAATVIDVLLRHKADPNAAEAVRGDMPLHWAAERGHLPAAMALVNAGASSRARATDGKEALHSAAMGHVQIVSWLVEQQNADLDAVRDYSGLGAIHVAAIYNSVDVLKYALVSGANMKILDDQGFKPLQYAIASQNQAVVDFYMNNC